MSQPKVSVVIPIYNRGEIIRKTVDSVLAQDLSPETFEILLVDDGSTDRTPQILDELYAGHPQIRIFHLKNGGVARARNVGLEKARGEFIAYLDHDDLWLPSKLSRQLAAFENRPEVGVVYCNWRSNVEDDALPEDVAVETPPLYSHPPEGEVLKTLLRSNFIISMSLPMMRTEDVRLVGGFNPKMVPSDDWDLWLRLAQRKQFVFIQEILLLYTRHARQQSKDNLRMMRSGRALFRQWWPTLRRHPRAAWNLGTISIYVRTKPRYDQARKALEEGKWGQLDKILLRALVANPWILISPQWIYVLLRRVKRDSSNFWR